MDITDYYLNNNGDCSTHRVVAIIFYILSKKISFLFADSVINEEADFRRLVQQTPKKKKTSGFKLYGNSQSSGKLLESVDEIKTLVQKTIEKDVYNFKHHRIGFETPSVC